MAFEKFTQNTRHTHRNLPMVAISTQGDIRPNTNAVRTFNILKYKYVAIHWDKDGRRVGLELYNDNDQKYVCRIRSVSRDTTLVISAMAFMRYINFDYSGDRAFALRHDEETGFLVFDL